MNKGVLPKASKLKLKADRPDRSNYFNYKNDGGKNTFCCAAIGPKLLSLPGVADTYTFLINTWNTLPKSFQQMVYNNSHAIVKRQIQQVENPMPTVFIRVEAGCDDNDFLLHYLTSEVAHEEADIGSTDRNIPTYSNCIDKELHFEMPWGSGYYEDEGDESEESDAINTGSWR
jgi:hypothetical protein